MEHQLQKLNIPFERIEAVDGRTAPESAHVHQHSRKVNEIGCALSHFKVYQKILEDGVTAALILEDDIVLTRDTYKAADELAQKQLDGSVFLFFLYGNNLKFSKRNAVALENGYTAYKAMDLWETYTAGAYFITAATAARLANFVYPVQTTADHWPTFYGKKVINGLYAVLPLTTRAAYFSSDIGYNLKTSWVRFIERKSLLVGRVLRYFKALKQNDLVYELVDEEPDWDSQTRPFF